MTEAAGARTLRSSLGASLSSIIIVIQGVRRGADSERGTEAMSDSQVTNDSQAELNARAASGAQHAPTAGERHPLPDRPWFRWYEQGVLPHLEIPAQPLTWMLDQTASRYPDQTAILYYGKTYTYAELATLVDRFATGLQRLGVRKGDRVAIALPNIPQYPIAFYGALKAGAVVVQTNPLYTQREMQHQLADAEARYMVLLEDFYPVIRAIRAELAMEQMILTSPAEYLPFALRWLYPYSQRHARRAAPRLTKKEWQRDATLHAWSEVMSAPASARVDVLMAGDDLAALQYTGGTTGLAKGAMLTHRNLLANTMQVRNWMAKLPDGQERILSAVPFFHAYGLTTCLNLSILTASAMVLLPQFKPKEVVQAIRKYRPTLFPGVPTMYLALVREVGEDKQALSSINYCISGAAPLPAKVQADFEAVSQGKVVEGYGLSEASPVTHCNPLNDQCRTGTIGLPLANIDAAILDQKTGEMLPVGEVGELAVQGPNIMQGYWKQPEATQAIFSQGWMLTGDLAKMDADGYFAIVDRAKDMIDASGLKVFPTEVEDVLFTHPAVQEAAVVGVPDEYRGETVAAFIVLKPGFEPSEKLREALRAYCKQNLAPYKVPTMVEFRESLPKSLIGKVLRRELQGTQRQGD
jgi:long-chain acyl-CoA synthetase